MTLLTTDKLGSVILNLQKTAEVPGDIIEVGVYQGGCLLHLAKEARKLKLNKLLFGYDTFKGLPKPSERDGNTHHVEGEFYSTIEEVNQKFIGYPSVYLIEGLFPESWNANQSYQFSFVHLDVDFYDSTLLSLIFIWPMLSFGGIIVVDDYDWKHTPGVKPAVDLFLKLISNQENSTFEIMKDSPHGQIAIRKNRRLS